MNLAQGLNLNTQRNCSIIREGDFVFFLSDHSLCINWSNKLAVYSKEKYGWNTGGRWKFRLVWACSSVGTCKVKWVGFDQRKHSVHLKKKKRWFFVISIFDSECVASASKIRNWYNVASDTDDQLLQHSKKECIQYEIHGAAVVFLIDFAE